MAALAWSRFEEVAGRLTDSLALRHGAETCSFADLKTHALDWAHRLPAGPGDRVILCAENSIDVVAATLGIWRCGAVPVWVNALAPPDHLRRARDETDAVCVVAPATIADLPVPVLTGSEAATARALPDLAPDAQALGSIVYTSGSTGRPKGVMQRASTLIDGADRIAGMLGYGPDDRILCPVPFAFDYGWGQMLSLVFRGIPLVLPAPNNAFGLCDAIAQARPTVLAAVPAALANLFSGLSPIRETDCSSIRLITNTGSRIPAPVLETLWQIFPQADLSLNYGLTETYRSTALPVALAQSKSHSVGAGVPGVEIAILDDAGQPCPPGTTGEVLHRGAGVFAGYWNDPETSARLRIPDPLAPGTDAMAVRTGDLGYLDDDGHLVLTGRRDRQMKSMGVRVSPDEIEAILLETGTITAAALVARPDETVGDLLVAFVVPPPGVDPQAALKALKRAARARLSPYMTPRLYHLVEALPRNPNGKVDYVALTRQAGAR